MPDISGNSCTAPVNSACCVSPSAGGNPRSARISRRQALPRRRRRPICRWCEHPGPVPGRWPRRSGPGTGATVRATVLSPGASALGTSCCAHQPSPTATAPSPGLSPSYPSPSPLSLLPVLTLCLPDSNRRKCGFHLGFGLAYVNEEPGRVDIVSDLLESSFAGEIQIYTSDLSRVEVAFSNSEKSQQDLDEETQAKIDGLWPTGL